MFAWYGCSIGLKNIYAYMSNILPNFHLLNVLLILFKNYKEFMHEKIHHLQYEAGQYDYNILISFYIYLTYLV